MRHDTARSSFPYAQLAAAHSRRRNAALLFSNKPTLLEAEPEAGSSIVLATTTLSEGLIQLYRDPQALRQIDRRLFEELVAEIFEGFGYKVELTAKTKDGGRDVIAVGMPDHIQVKYLIECKRPDPGNAIGVGIVRQLLGVVEDERATKGILVATTYFSPDAKALEARNKWRLELKEYEQIVEWIARYIQLKGK